MKLLSFQPVSMYQNGGAARVLRRLYAGNQTKVTAVAVIVTPLEQHADNEIIINAMPLQRNWMRWKLRNIARWLREVGLSSITHRKVHRVVAGLNADVIHTIHHGPYADALGTTALLRGKQHWVSFHDHFTTAGGPTFKSTRKFWLQATRRLVISEEMGQEYNRLFGKMPFEVITDGLSADEIEGPRILDGSRPLSIYFSGLLHLEYYPLFQLLAAALDELSDQGYRFQLILRGTQQLDFLRDRKFETTYRTDFISDEAIKNELNSADILYLPIKFTTPEFYKYSMSTKMVGYLGAPGSILYHGPADAAVCKLLVQAGAAVCCTTLNVAALIQSFKELVNGAPVSANAKRLATEKFNIDAIRSAFWSGFETTPA